MIVLRSLAFAALFYLWSSLMALIMTPLLLAPRGAIAAVARVWISGTIAMLRAVCEVRVEIRGRENLAPGPLLICAKHQCMFDTMAPLLEVSDGCYVMRKELARIPLYGALTGKAGMIVIDREGGSRALRGLVADARSRIAEGRQVFIFPEGSRTAPGSKGDYKPGAAALYRELGLGCTPMATNSGTHWPAHGFLRRPGRIVYQFLPPIPTGLRRAEFMRALEEAIETASMALLGE